jgi:hypothetical protein
LALVWFVKLVTDPVTDLEAYVPRFLGPWGKPRPPAVEERVRT